MTRRSVNLSAAMALVIACLSGSVACRDDGVTGTSEPVDADDAIDERADEQPDDLGLDADADVEQADAVESDRTSVEDLRQDEEPVVEPPCSAVEPDIICVGSALRRLTPPRYETVNPAYLSRENTPEQPHTCPHPDVLPRCGVLSSRTGDDCGTDGLCEGDPDYTAPDGDGSEGDGAPDWFFDCGMDRLCPDDPGYSGPDEDGSEGNGDFDGFWIAGFNLNRPMAGVMDDIWARALVLNHKGATVAFFVADLVGFHYDHVERVRARHREKYPDDRVDYLLMQSTHTHEAPDSMGLWGPLNPSTGLPAASGIVDWWMDWIIEQMADAVHDAYLSQQRAELWIGSALTGVTGILRDSRAPIVFDDRVTTMQFRAEDDQRVIATALHWSNHPEALWSENNLQSSDFVHFARTFVGEGLPQRGDLPPVPGVGGDVLYLQGAIGGLITPPNATTFRDGTEVSHRGPEMAEAMGERLALVTFEALEGAERIDDLDGIRWVNRVYYLVVENTLFQLASLSGFFGGRVYYTQDGEPYPHGLPDPDVPTALRTEQAIIRIGRSVTWYTYPGELFPEFAQGGFDGSRVCGRAQSSDCGNRVVPLGTPNPPSLDLAPSPPYTEAIVPGRHRFLLGLALDEVGYLVPAYDFELDESSPYLAHPPGHYEETNSVGPAAPVPDEVIRELAVEAAALYR